MRSRGGPVGDVLGVGAAVALALGLDCGEFPHPTRSIAVVIAAATMTRPAAGVVRVPLRTLSRTLGNAQCARSRRLSWLHCAVAPAFATCEQAENRRGETGQCEPAASAERIALTTASCTSARHTT